MLGAKRIFILFGLLAAALPLGAWDGPAWSATVLGERVNLRAGPAIKYPVVSKLPGGRSVTVIGRSAGWYRVAADATGWVSEDFLRLDLGGGVDGHPRAAAAAQQALELLGHPYAYGRAGPESFDCSGLTTYVFGRIGVKLPRSSAGQMRAGLPVRRQDLTLGDLVFFRTNGRDVSHVGIYLYGGEFIHASSARGRVTTSTMSQGYYERYYAGAARVIQERSGAPVQ